MADPTYTVITRDSDDNAVRAGFGPISPMAGETAHTDLPGQGPVTYPALTVGHPENGGQVHHRDPGTGVWSLVPDPG